MNIIRKVSTSTISTVYKTIKKGSLYTPEYRIYVGDDKGPISPFHDIPLYANAEENIFNMVVEIPRWTNVKMEINMKEELNPIMQDIKKGEPRFVPNLFPFHGCIWNYGALPQTWETPDHVNEIVGFRGDNDPIDVLEIGYRVAERGEILQIKVLGILGLIDVGELDWKIVAIDIHDPLAKSLKDIEDVEEHCPGLLKASVEWFKIYKIPDGESENQFAFNGEAKSAAFALNTVKQMHEFWRKLVRKEVDSNGISCVNLKVSDSPFLITVAAARNIIENQQPESEPKPIDPIVDKWHYIRNK